MKRILIIGICTIILLTINIQRVNAQTGDTSHPIDAEFEAQIEEELIVINPDALDEFKAGSQAYYNGDYETALKYFELVISKAPQFSHAVRRMAFCYSQAGDIEKALATAEQALSLEPITENKMALALILLGTDSPQNWQRANNYSVKAIEIEPDNINYLLTHGISSLYVEKVDEGKASFLKIIEIDPENMVAYYYLGLLEGYDGNYDAMQNYLEKALAFGMPAEEIQLILDSFRWPIFLQSLPIYLGIGLVIWLGLMVLFLIIGSILSKITLAGLKNINVGETYQASLFERIVRLINSVIIGLAAIYYYLSIPVLIIIILALLGLMVLIFMEIGQIPIRLALILGFAGLYTLYALIRSVFVRSLDEEPGRKLKELDAPELWKTVRSVADKIGTKPVDEIFLVIGVEIAVMEKGSLIKKLTGRSKRYLILGLGALENMNISQFRSILAHEYGHFVNKDTAGGNIAYQVKLSMRHTAYALDQQGMANWTNPAWLFLNTFHKVFSRIIQGASRLKEVLADRYAALAYSPELFEESLKNLIWQSLVFNEKMKLELNLAHEEKRQISNFYTLPDPNEIGDVKKEYYELLKQNSSPYDSHPAPKERFMYIQNIKQPGGFPDTREMWSLFNNPEEIQIAITRSAQPLRI